MLKISRRASDPKVIPAQVLLFLLVEHGLDLHSVALMVEIQIGRRKVVLLDLVSGSRARIAHIKVAGLDRMDEVGVGGYDGLIRILFGVDN